METACCCGQDEQLSHQQDEHTKIPMQYETPDGLCVVVGAVPGGCRLQQFVARNFREYLGRQSDAMHVNVRHAAAVACQRGCVLIDGQVAVGRQNLFGGEVVTLLKNSLDSLEQSDRSGSFRRGAPRMLVHMPEDTHSPGALGIPSWEGGSTSGSYPGSTHFRQYYRDLQRLLPREDWEQCEQLFMRPVPLSLRMNLSSPQHRETMCELQQTFGTRIEMVPWMKSFGGALHIAPTFSSEEASEGLRLVNMLASAGDIVVQDGLSMLAAAALDPNPGQTVLDLCSAPGSKTCQLLDALSRRASETGDLDAECSALVANDMSAERSQRTWGRARAQNCTSLIVTAADGVQFPQLVDEGFDRILVDAPCSSDGTIRKERKRLQRWKVDSALNHHALQIRLLHRGLELLKPGGRLIYSTCCLNPIECEAVVQAALDQSSSDVHLLAAEDVLPPGCPRGSPGLKSWCVPVPSEDRTGTSSDTTFKVYHSWDEVDEGNEVTCRSAIQRTMFPGRLAQQGSLSSCARFLPIHGPNFGGFFLAAFTKILGFKNCSQTECVQLEFIKFKCV